MNSVFVTLAIVSLVLISFAHLTNFILLKNKPQNHTLQKVSIIIKGWWLIIGFILITLGTAPYGLLIGFLAISLLCVFEYLQHSCLLEFKRMIAGLVILSILLQYAALYSVNWSLYFSVPLLFMFLGTALIVIYSGKVERFPEIFSSCPPM